MTELIYVNNDQPVTTSLAIADGVENPHKSVIQLIRNNLEDLQQFGPIAFEMRKGGSLPQGGFAKPTEYAILNERQATLLMTYMRNNKVVKEFKIRLVKAFYELAEKARKPAEELDRIELLKMALEAEEQKLQMRNQINELIPKAKALDKIATATDSICMRDAAKNLQVRPKDLRNWLLQNKWVYQRAGNDTLFAYQDKIHRGLLEHKCYPYDNDEGESKVSTQVRITPKGLAKISEESIS